MKIGFVGDVMLGRFVREKHQLPPYCLVDPSIEQYVTTIDYCVGNLESPITDIEESDSLKFAGNEALLKCFNWIDCFSLSNNHINDFGEKGMTDTIRALDKNGFDHNGLFVEEYSPFFLKDEKNQVAIITCTDMLNKEFEDRCKYHTLRADSQLVNDYISLFKDSHFVIVFAHVGHLFSRYPNPEVRNILYSWIDAGASCVVTVHSHCLGGFSTYKGFPIFYSLGDFLMDGASFRRRQSGILVLEIECNRLKEWDFTPTITTNDLKVVIPNDRKKRMMIRTFSHSLLKMEKMEQRKYKRFYSFQYKIELLSHSLSTIHFVFSTKGIKGLLRILINRAGDVKQMISRIAHGRNNMRYDSDAVSTNLSNKDCQ